MRARFLLYGAIASVGLSPICLAQVTPPPAPFSRATYRMLEAQPDLLRRLMAPAAIPRVATLSPPATSPWKKLTNQPPFSAGAMLQLTDGTVMVEQEGTSNGTGAKWWRLTPDKTGSYLNGTWSALASMPTGYAPLYFASAILPDSRVIVEGGEYNQGKAVWTSLGAIYDPVKNKWTSVSPPAGTAGIGDAQGLVLANGAFMLSPVYLPASGAQQILNPTTLTWSATGAGKQGGNDEESQSLLPNGDVLTVDINPSTTDNSEAYDPASGAWVTAGSTKVTLYDSSSEEIGPEALRPNGTVLAVGASKNNAVFNVATQTWAKAASFPLIGGKQYDVADGPAAVLPSGKVLVMASPGVYQTPSHFFVFDGATMTQVTDAPNAASMSSYYGYMLVLPTGQVMFNGRIGEIDLYTDSRAPAAGWAPVITSAPTKLVAGTAYTLAGKQLSGLSQGATYGDDYQSATNYPLVRIVNNATKHVFYAITRKFTSMSVAPNKASSTVFQIPAAIETGASTLVTIANGIPSAPVSVTVSAK